MSLPVPHLSPAAPTVLARLAQGLPARLSWHGALLILALEPAARAPAGWARCAGMLGEGSFTLAVDPALLEPALAEHWPGEALPPLPRGLAELVLEALLDPWFDRLDGWLGQRPVLEAMPGAEPPHLLGARDEDGRLRALLRLDDVAARRLASALPPSDPSPADPPIRCDVILDRVALPAGVLASLGPGDVVMLDTLPEGEDDWLVRLSAGKMNWRGRLAGGQLNVIARMEAELEQPQQAGATGLDDIPVLVEAVIGEMTLPLSRLQELAPGMVLELGPEALRSLALRVAGRPYGRAELVMLGGRPGLRILALGGDAG